MRVFKPACRPGPKPWLSRPRLSSIGLRRRPVQPIAGCPRRWPAGRDLQRCAALLKFRQQRAADRVRTGLFERRAAPVERKTSSIACSSFTVRRILRPSEPQLLRYPPNSLVARSRPCHGPALERWSAAAADDAPPGKRKRPKPHSDCWCRRKCSHVRFDADCVVATTWAIVVPCPGSCAVTPIA